ncbi:MAG: hypothetical protein ACK4JY_02735 [Brevundimonas sp.]|uniref:hypothetical protein n=1 Tax=Brevundimonas sp. TaxID=1871086 RepID=UPI00391D8DE8
MDQTPGHASEARANPSIGWPMPWWSLLAGCGFVALMTTPAGLAFGFVMIWAIIMLAMPFMMISAAIGGPAGNHIAFGLALATYILVPVLVAVRGILKAPDRSARALQINGLVLWLALLVGVAVSLRALVEAWPSH